MTPRSLNESFSPAWAIKLRRAGTHIDDLRLRVDQHLAGSPFEVVAEEADGGRVVVVHINGDTSIPEEWSAIVGDALHNMRSALDSLVVSLAERHLERPLSEQEEKVLQFPICSTPKAWGSEAGRRLANVSKDAVAEVRNLQPFVPHELAGMQDEEQLQALFESSPLGRLERLSNVDKHRRVHLAAGHAWVPYLMTSGAVGVSAFEWVDPPPWVEGSIVCRWTLDQADSPPRRNALRLAPQVGARTSVCFLSDIKARSEQTVVSSLESIHRSVAMCVLRLEGFLS